MVELHKHIDYRKRFIGYYIRQHYKTILDLSAGIGMFPEYYRWLGLDVTATENDPDKLSALKSAGFKTRKVDLDIKKSLPFKDNQFDICTCTEVIEHIKNPKAIVQEMLRVAKCLAVITTPVGKSYSSSDHIHHWFNKKELAENALGHISYPSQIDEIITKLADENNSHRSFVVAIFKEEQKQ